MLHLICQQIWKTQQWPRDWKRSVFIPIPKKGNAKECSNYCTIALISHASKVSSKFSKPVFNSMWTENFQMFKLNLVKAEEQEIKLPSPLDCRKSKRVPEKHLTSASLTMLKPLTVWITTNCGKFLKSWEYQTTLSVSRETCMWIKKQQLEQWVVQNWERNMTRLHIIILLI